nr:unnamed protein product [Haemonchus contortus]
MEGGNDLADQFRAQKPRGAATGTSISSALTKEIAKMMLLLFTVLLSAVYSEAGDCKASEIVVMNPGSLPPTIAGPLEKELKSVKVDLYDFEGTAAYYVGNVGAPDQYTAVCLSGKKVCDFKFLMA